MKNKLLIFLCIVSVNSYAGFNGYTMHSRANCGNNETISWDWTTDWYLATNSYHYDAKTKEFKHDVADKLRATWRSAAVCWGEGLSGGWLVNGQHWRYYSDGTLRLDQWEEVTDCSIYDGWWEKDKIS